jgi:hypothetical protein
LATARAVAALFVVAIVVAFAFAVARTRIGSVRIEARAADNGRESAGRFAMCRRSSER